MSGDFLSSFALFDADHRLVEWNADFAREYEPVGVSLKKGMSYREMLEAAAAKLTTEQIFAGHPAVGDPRRELMDRLAGFGQERTSEYRNGSDRVIRIEERRSLSGGILRYAHDVTDIREAGSALLRASRQQLDAGATDLNIAQVEMRRSPDGIYDIPPIPESVRRLLEFTPDMVGKDPMIVYTRMIGGAEPLNFRVQLEEAAKNLLICSFEYRVRDGKDRVRWIRQSMMPHPQSDGSMLFTGAMRDITREREAEDQVELLRSVVVRSTDSIAVFESDPEGPTTILYVNDKFTDLFGGVAETLIGQPIDVMSGNDINGLGAKLMNEALARDDGEPVEYETGGRDGRVFWVEMRVKTVQKLENGGSRWVVISRDITERRHVQDELQRAKEQAEASNRAKGEFLANMSHELRTPLNAIIGFTELIEHGIAQTGWTDNYKEYLADVSGSGRHLLDLINTILDLSKIEAGQLELDLEPVDLCELTRTSLALVSGMAHDGQITVKTDIPEGCPELRGDFLKLKQVLLNIFSNAIKFTPAGGKVAVRVTFTESRAAVVVSDTGCGIPASDLKRVTLPFVQVASSLSRKYGGSGLGLSIARQLCELHGGKLTIRSTEGKGTTVRITLPLAARQAANQDQAAISATIAARS